MPKKKKEGKISVLKFKVVGAEKVDRDRWKHLANQIKRVTNSIRRIWLLEHTRLGNDFAVRQYMQSVLDWHKADPASRGDKPKCGVKCITPAIQAAIYSYVTGAFIDVNMRPVSLAMNLTAARLKSDPGSKSAFPRWMLILADDGEYPSSSSPQPIPFDDQNCEIIVPIKDGDDFHVKLRIDRIGRPGKKPATSTADHIKIQTKGKNCASQTAHLWKIAEGEYALCGSNLVFRESTGEWFVHICYRSPMPEKAQVDPDKTAILRPGKKRPWTFRAAGDRSLYVGGRSGRHVHHVRRQLLTQRWSRQEAYRHAGSARKGHGRKRAMGKVFLLQNRWKDFVKTVNQQVAKEVIDRCVSSQSGRLVYRQPADGSDRFLHTAGKVPGRTDGTGWDWAQVKAMLETKCKEAGIELVVKKTRERRRAYELPVASRNPIIAASYDNNCTIGTLVTA